METTNESAEPTPDEWPTLDEMLDMTLEDIGRLLSEAKASHRAPTEGQS